MPNACSGRTLRRCLGSAPALHLLRFALVAAWGVLIFSFTLQTGDESAEVSSSVTDGFYAFLEIAVPERTFDYDAVHSFLRTGAHFGLYFFLGIWFANAMRPLLPFAMTNVNAVLASLIVALGDEFTQRFVEGRVMSLADVYTDTAGALLGVTLFAILQWYAFGHRQLHKEDSEADSPQGKSG